VRDQESKVKHGCTAVPGGSAPVDSETLWVLRCAYCRKQVVTGGDAVCRECGRFVAPAREAERKARQP
jgi:rRNA maturation endonuclease Nob1